MGAPLLVELPSPRSGAPTPDRAVTDWGIAVAALVALAIVLGFLLMRRDKNVRLTRWGFFVERDRYQDDEDDLEQPDEAMWPKHDDP